MSPCRLQGHSKGNVNTMDLNRHRTPIMKGTRILIVNIDKGWDHRTKSKGHLRLVPELAFFYVVRSDVLLHTPYCCAYI